MATWMVAQHPAPPPSLPLYGLHSSTVASCFSNRLSKHPRLMSVPALGIVLLAILAEYCSDVVLMFFTGSRRGELAVQNVSQSCSLQCLQCCLQAPFLHKVINPSQGLGDVSSNTSSIRILCAELQGGARCDQSKEPVMSFQFYIASSSQLTSSFIGDNNVPTSLPTSALQYRDYLI